MNYSPQPVFAPVHPGAHITGSIECLIAVEADGDVGDCNKAAGDIVDELQRRFDGIVETTGDLLPFEDMTYTERDDFVYYSIMETLGHGVGLCDDPGRFPEDAIELARDKTSDLNKAVVSLVAWMEMNVSYDWNDQRLTVEAVVEVITRESVENSEAAGRFTIPATAFEIGDWMSWIDCFDLDDRNEDDVDNSEEYTPMEFVQMLDACGLTFEGTYWASSAGRQDLLATTGYRRLPSVRLSGIEVEVISASISVRVTKVVDPQGDDNVATPEGLESGRDSYYDRYKAATAAKEEVSDADPS
jgi:hypothetical protein